MAKFIATMNSYFKYLIAAGSTYTDSDKLDEMITRVNSESLVFATQIRETCNDNWARVCAKLSQTSEILRIRAVLDGGTTDVDAETAATAEGRHPPHRHRARAHLLRHLQPLPGGYRRRAGALPTA